MNKPSNAMLTAGSAALTSARGHTVQSAREIYLAMERQRMKDERRTRQEASARRQHHNTPWDTPAA